MEFQRNVIDVAENNDGEKNENVIDVDGGNNEGENIENVTFVESGEIKIGMQPFSLRSLTISERGNQRERDRERAQARAGGKSKQPKGDGLTPEQRRERDAKALQEKAARKAAQSAGGNNAGGGGLKR
nr:hypothetical protein CFP56_35916 [Quercus suber]